MPTVHPRIGLVSDPPVAAALELFRDVSGATPPAATAARAAVLQGAVLEAIEREAQSGSANRSKAVEALALVNELLPSLDMPQEILGYFSVKLQRTIESSRREERRARQLAMLKAPDPYGQVALSIAEDFDSFDREAED